MRKERKVVFEFILNESEAFELMQVLQDAKEDLNQWQWQHGVDDESYVIVDKIDKILKDFAEA